MAAIAGWRAVEATDSASAGPTAVASGLVSCVLAPEQTEGPYYLPGDRLRKNITEGKPGVPLTLKLSVVDVQTCKPIKGAAVDIWHCDALGTYAAQTNATFLRGIQKTDAKGMATFVTVYPGWYQGRTVHIHVKVALGGNVVHTGQLYFADCDNGQGVSPLSVSQPARPHDAEPGRRHLPKRRQAVDSSYREGGLGLHGLDHDGRPALAVRPEIWRSPAAGGLRRPSRAAPAMPVAAAQVGAERLRGRSVLFATRRL